MICVHLSAYLIDSNSMNLYEWYLLNMISNEADLRWLFHYSMVCRPCINFSFYSWACICLRFVHVTTCCNTLDIYFSVCHLLFEIFYPCYYHAITCVYLLIVVWFLMRDDNLFWYFYDGNLVWFTSQCMLSLLSLRYMASYN